MSTDAGDELCLALEQRALGLCRVDSIVTRDWFSATFAGARHEIAMRISHWLADAFADLIEEAEFELRGHFVADLTIVSRAVSAEETAFWIEALTIETS